jgi:signal transduction histidine kinase/ActR/RegA family two-component response regulator
LFAWSWTIEAIRAAILLRQVHDFGDRPGDWYCIADILCFFASWCLFAGCADLAGVRLPTWLAPLYFLSGIPLVIFNRYLLPLILAGTIALPWQEGRFWGVFLNLVLMFLPVSAARLTILVWLLGIWRRTRLAGAGLAFFFSIPYAVFALAVPITFYFSYSASWIDFAWCARVFGFSTGLVMLVLGQQQADLLKSETSLAAAQALVRLGSWEMDLTTRNLSWSAEMYNLYERDPEQGPMMTAEIRAIVHADDLVNFDRLERQTFVESRATQAEFRIVPIGADFRWLASINHPVSDPSGRVVRVLGTVQDVTTRKRAELQIQHLNRVYSVLSDINQTIVRAADLPALFDAACRVAVEKGGFRKAWVGLVDSSSGKLEVVAQAADLSYDPKPSKLAAYASLADLVRQYNKLAVGNDIEFDPLMMSQREAAPLRSYRSCAAFPLTIDRCLRGVIGFYAGEAGFFDAEETRLLSELAADISFAMEAHQREVDRRRAVEELRWRTAFLEAQVASAADGILVVDSQGKRILQNQRLIDTLKIPREIADHAESAHLLQFVQQRIKQPRPVVEEIGFLQADPNRTIAEEVELLGGTILELYSAPVRGGDGEYFGRVWTFRDVSKSRRLEEQLRQSQKMEAIGQLAGGVAHDFNNILVVILVQSEMLKAEPGIPKAAANLAEEIGQAAQRAAGLTRQLLLFSRRQVMQPRDLNLNEIVNNLGKMLQRILGEDISLQFDCPPQPLIIRADVGMVEQVLTNLVVNSRDAMPRGGRLKIETAAVDFDESAASRCAGARAGSFACLTVSDTGTGIPPEVLPRIFEPFFTTKEMGKGTGLGLATVFGILQQHRGWINVDSQASRGTTFRVYFPRLSSVPSRRTPADLITLKPQGGSETILVVEDEAVVRGVVRAALTSLGYRVLEADSCLEALALWPEHRGEIRLLLTDLLMPGGMNGIELAERLRQDNPKLPVICASGYSADTIGKDLSHYDGFEFLPKPFEIHKLAQTIRKSLYDS